MGVGGLQVGRDAERERLASVLTDAAAGHPGAVLVAGEAGIGKTSLVAGVTSGPAATGHRVLWGRCLRFGADSSPYLPIGQVLTQWYRQADASERTRVLTGAEHLATIAPALGAASGPVDVARVPPLVAAVVDRLTTDAPLVIVVDDVQWADGTSLDLLAYLLAGFSPGQRLCLLVTYRDTELGEGHRLHGWLADCARLPSVSRLHLERLGLADTEELVLGLRGDASGSSGLAEEIYGKSDGNPYYTELLVRGHDDDGPRSARDGLPSTLLGSWHRLSAPARELLQLLAVGGRPVGVSVLEGLSAAHGRNPEQVASSLAEATGAGLTTTTPDGDVWFHHPLLAEVIAGTLTPTGQQLVHKQYVEVIESAADLTPSSRAAHLALHHAGAGDSDQAFVWSLRAADQATAVRGYAEESEHLHRACLLWQDVGEATRAAAGQPVDLWQRASESAWSAGEYLSALHLREQAIALVDEAEDPVRAVRLRLPLPGWRVFCGLDVQASVEVTRSTLELAQARCLGTPEYVQALARLAHAELWVEDVRSMPHAYSAVRWAGRTGSLSAMAWALSVRSQLPPWGRSIADAAHALTLAREVGDPELLGWATVTCANRLSTMGRDPEAADVLLTTFRQLADADSLHEGGFAGGNWGALILLELGQWQEARELLRLLLSHRLPAGAAAPTRAVAALLALRTGDSAGGRAHLARLHELHPQPARPGELLDTILVETHWALGELRESLARAADAIPGYADLDPRGGDELMMTAARAAGDLAEAPGRGNEAVMMLDLVEHRRDPRLEPFMPMSEEDLIHPARGALFAADRARCHGERDTSTLWQDAVSACGAAGLVWHEALASYQLARALLRERGGRYEAASALRHAAQIATDLGAAPILRDCEELARQAHFPLAGPAPSTDGTRDGDPFSSLTAREREVLSLVAEGRSNGDISKELFISVKTASVHVSHILAKLGAGSRTEAVAVARRTGLLD